MRVVKKGTTDVSVVIRIVDSTDGTPETAVEHNTSGIDLFYRREGAAVTSITEAALAALTTAHTDGGIEHIGAGYYRLDLPDAACATGASGVMVGGTITGMVVIGCYIQLVDYDPFDAVRLGLTALPNIATGSAGGLSAELDDIQSRIPAALVSGRIDASVGAMASNVITAAATAADFTTEVTSGLATAANVSAVETDTQDIQARLPAALSSGRIPAVLDSTNNEAIATAVWTLADAIASGVTPKEAVRHCIAMLSGKVSGAGTGTETFRNIEDDADEAVITVDGSGNRTGVTRTFD